MRKFICLLVIIILSAPVFGSEGAEAAAAEKPEPIEYIVYDVHKHIDNSDNILLALGGLSIGAGAGILANSNPLTVGIGIQSILWGMGETAFGVYKKNWAVSESDDEKARTLLVEAAGKHILIDLAFVAAGSLMLILGDEALKGHGAGIMIHGTALAILNTVNFVIASNPGEVRGWGAGINVYIAAVPVKF